MDQPISSTLGTMRIRLTAVSILAAVALAACTSSVGGSAEPSLSQAGSPAATVTLEGTLWRLTKYVGAEGNALPVPEAVSASATFGDGMVAGNAGCNDYSGSYTVNGDKLTIGPVAATRKACGPAESLVETAYFATLGRVASYSIDGNALELKTTEGKVGLRFVATAAASLTGPRWVATGVNNGTGGVVSVIADTSITAIFGPNGTVAGSGGCNTYDGPYTSDGTSIKFGPLAATLKLCGTPAGVDDQEAQYFAALQKVTKYTITGNVLELRDDSGALQVDFRPTLGSP